MWPFKSRLVRALERLQDSIDHNHKDLIKIMATQAEHAQELRNITTQNEKARQEIIARIQQLEEALDSAGGTTPEVDEALVALKASVQTDDDLHTDAEPV